MRMTQVTWNTRTWCCALLAGGLALAGGCGAARPPAPPPVHAGVAGVAGAATGPDALFMQGMIAHHAQALAMSRLVAPRTTSRDIRMLADRIAASQTEEIALMERWLRARGHGVPDTTHIAMGHHVTGDTLMPGMLTAAQLGTLQDSRGPEFDRLFLALMIQHHEGALAMVEQLLASPGGRQDAEAYRFASDVDADQRAEIARMRRLLAARG